MQSSTTRLKVGNGAEIDLEEARARRLAGEADVGDGDLVAVGVFAGRLVLQMGLQRGQRGAVPVLRPFRHGGLVELELMGEIFAHPRHDQRMRVGGDDLRQAPHPRAALRVLRQQRRIGMGLVEIFDDGERFEQRRPVAVDQRRDRHHRIDLAEGLLALLALHQIDLDDLVGLEPLQIHRDAHAIGRERPPERKQFHDTVLPERYDLRSAGPIDRNVGNLFVAADVALRLLVAGERLLQQRQVEAALLAFRQHLFDVLDAAVEA